VTAADPNREPLENEKLTQAELARPQKFFHFRGAAVGTTTLTLSTVSTPKETGLPSPQAHRQNRF
jgi:hypothetical protein